MKKQKNKRRPSTQWYGTDIPLYSVDRKLRSGKSFIAVYAIIIRAARTRSRHAIVRRTFNAVKRSIFLDTLPKVLSLCFPNLPVKWNKSDFYIKLPNQSEVWIFGLDDNRADRILGLEFSSILFEESSELDYSAMQVVLSRLAEKNELKKRVYYTFNPPSKIHWSYYLFIKQLNPIDSEPLSNRDEYNHILMNPRDNLMNIDEEYLEILKRMPDRDRQRFLEGEFRDVDEGAAYYSFNMDTMVSDDVCMVPGRLAIGMDFNYNPMTAVILQVVGNEYHAIDEVYLENSDTYKMCDFLIKKGYIGNVYPDSSCKNRRTSGISDFEILKTSGFVIEHTHNPFVTDRVNNMNRLMQEGRIVISSKCKRLINDLSKVSWKDNKLDQKTDPTLTHISDAFSYALWKIDPLRTIRKSRSFNL